MKKKFVCTVCGYVHEGDEAPEKCPMCGAPRSKFKEEVPKRVTKKFVCTVCGYVYEGDEAPETCPVCGAPREEFKEQAEAAAADTVVESRALTGKWNVDMTHARIGFEIKHCGLSFVSGHFADFVIDINAKGEHLLDTEIVVTVRPDSVYTGVQARDNHLRTADFFDTDKYPEMVFRSGKITRHGDREGDIAGELTLCGVTKPVVFKARLIDCMPSPMTGQTTAGFRLTGVVKRSDFNFATKFLPAIIGDEVNVIVDAEFTPAE